MVTRKSLKKNFFQWLNKDPNTKVALVKFFSGGKVRSFCYKKWPKQHDQKNFLENLQKDGHILRKKVMKLPRYLEELGRFLAFFFGNYHI